MRFFCIIGVTLGLVVGAQADDVYNDLNDPVGSGTLVGDGTQNSDGVYVNGLFNSFMTGSLSETLTGVNLLLEGPQLDPVTVTLYTDAAPAGYYDDPMNPQPIDIVPNSGIELGTVPLTGLSPTVYAVSPLASVVLAADTRYWIALSESSVSGSEPGPASWVRVSSTGNDVGVTGEYSAVGTSNPVTLNANTPPFGMEIVTAVPEPFAFFPLIGLAGFAASRLRGRRA